MFRKSSRNINKDKTHLSYHSHSKWMKSLRKFFWQSLKLILQMLPCLILCCSSCLSLSLLSSLFSLSSFTPCYILLSPSFFPFFSETQMFSPFGFENVAECLCKRWYAAGGLLAPLMSQPQAPLLGDFLAQKEHPDVNSSSHQIWSTIIPPTSSATIYTSILTLGHRW